MKPLVVIENDKVITDSLTIAKAFNKKHSDILSYIKSNIKNSIDAEYSNWIKRNIELTNYQHQQDKQYYPKFNLTKAGFAIIGIPNYNLKDTVTLVRFLDAFEKSEQLLSAKVNSMQVMSFGDALMQAGLLQLEKDSNYKMRRIGECKINCVTS